MSSVLMKPRPLYEKLWEKQKYATNFCLERDSAALFLEQRVGKTWISGAVIEAEAKPGYYALIVVPLTNKESTWVTFLNRELPHVEVRMDLEKPDPNKATVVLMHYEQARSWRKKLKRKQWSRIIIDESHRLKNRGSGFSRMARMIRYSSDRMMILSGTPIDKQPQDLWGQFRFLVPDLFGESWKLFDTEYLRPCGYMGYKREFRWEKLPQLLKLIEPYSLRITKDAMGIKDPKIIRHIIPLVGPQRRLYEKVERESVAKWKGHRIFAGMTITQNVLLQQICGGFVKDENKETHWVGDAKIRRLRFLLRTSKPPVVVFCVYRREIERVRQVAKEMGLSVGLIRGGRKNKAVRSKILKNFQDGKYDVLICQIRTGGVGVDLWRATVAIVYSLTYSYIDFEQMKARLDCIGKKELNTIHLLMVKNTIDEDKFRAILSKRSVSNRILTRLKQRRIQEWQKKRRKSSSSASTT